MSGKTFLWAAVFVFIGMAIFKAFKTDTTDPSAVLTRYLSHWESNNSTGMYPLISQRAKAELQKQKVLNVIDYYTFFSDKRPDIGGFELVTQELRDDNGRYWVVLKVVDMLGRESTENATFYVIKEADGWRVDGWQKSGTYSLP
ncbi:MAG: hypothetical protein WBP42_07705 [Candidatus Zixiibacteriota bacterium]